jgi:hypothetical protein
MDRRPGEWHIRDGSGRAAGDWHISGSWEPPSLPPQLEPPVPPAWATPEPGAAAPRRSGRLAASLATFVLVAGAALGAIGAVRLLHAPGDALSPMVPESTAVYMTAYLQPSGDQMLALSALASKFPVLASSSERAQWIDGLLDDALQGSGLDHSDVLPWLGAQVGLSVDAQALAGGDSSSGSAYALYVSTTDASATQAALQKWRNAETANQDGIAYAFTTQVYQGVTITAVTENLGPLFQNISSELAERPGAAASPASTVSSAPSTPVCSYAIVDNALVVAGSTGYLDEIIDTDQGRAASLDANSDYETVLGQLPSDRLGLLFLDYPAILQALQSELSGEASAGVSIQPEVQMLQAYRGMGVGVEAQSDGLAIDAVTDYDASQLSADQRAVMDISPDRNAAAAITPASAAAFYGFAGTQYLVREVVDSLEQVSPEVGTYLSESGLGAALLDLTGDFGIELDGSQAGGVAGALIVGTDDPAATSQFLDQVLPSVIGQTTVPGETEPAPTLGQVTYRGVDITVYDLPAAGDSLAWTVTGGEAIVATSPDELEAIIDAMDGAPSLAQSSDYARTAGAGTTVAVGYIDMAQLTGLIDSSLPASMQASFEQNVLPNLRPITSVSMTESNTSSESAAHVLIEVG